MKVKVLLNLGTNDYGDNALPAGEHEVGDSFGRLLISRRHAVEAAAKTRKQQRRKKPDVSVKAVAPQGEVVAEQSPVSVEAQKPKPTE
jgi:hypothetical protein